MKSKVSFVILNTLSVYYAEYAGPARIAAYLRMHKIPVLMQYFNVNEETALGDILREIPEDVNIIGFPIYDTNAEYVYKLSALLKARNPKCIISVGSSFATTAASFILDDCNDIDLVVLGDGELTMYNLVLKYEENDLDFSNMLHVKTRFDVSDKRPMFVNIETMPFAARDFFEQKASNNFFSARLSGSSGCVAKCSFCSIADVHRPVKHHRKWQGRSIDDIFEEIKCINKKYGIKSFSFTDNSFEDPGKLGKQRIRDFCEKVINNNERFHFWCYLRAETFHEEDIELIKLMRKAGFTQVFIGIEASHQKDLDLYNKRASVEDNIRTWQLFTGNDIDINPGYIMFHPFSDMETLSANFLFLKRFEVPVFKAYYRHIEIYYGTGLYQAAKNSNLLAGNYSYLNTQAYVFENEEVQRLSDFIMQNLKDSPVEKEDSYIQTFRATLSYMKAIYPGVVEKYSNDLDSAFRDIAHAYSDFFSVLYLKGDIELASAMWEETTGILLNLYKKVEIIKLKMIKRNPELMNLFC